jgi:drug/metabolite transporter (DMT)-like permease
VNKPTSLHSGALASLGPALLGATSFAVADVLSKFALKAGADPLTLSTVRGVLGLLTVLAWLQLGERPPPLAPRAKWISLGLGVIFAANIFLLFSAFQVVEVPIAILTYFVYPLLTGLVAAATGLDKLTWRGLAAAVVAFLGLALMIGAHPAALAVWGIIAALGAACCRVVMLLVTRAELQGVDARLITWYSLASSSALLALISLVTLTWQPPETVGGWLAVIAVSIAVTTGIMGVFASTMRIGLSHRAVMNLEPPLATLGSALLLGELITPLQALGGAIMIGAWWRSSCGSEQGSE